MSLLLSARGLRLESTRGPLLIYDDVDLVFETRLWLSGSSGSGKSMLCRAMTSLLPPGVVQQGRASVTRGGQVVQAPLGDGDAEPDAPDQRPIRVVYIPQSAGSALPAAIGCMALATQVAEWSRPQPARVEGRWLLQTLGLSATQLEQLQAHQLSGGMAQRFAIALGLLARPDLLVLDEPIFGLDDASRSLVFAAFESAPIRELPMIVVSHDPAVARLCRSRLVLVRSGQRVSFLAETVEGGDR